MNRRTILGLPLLALVKSEPPTVDPLESMFRDVQRVLDRLREDTRKAKALGYTSWVDFMSDEIDRANLRLVASGDARTYVIKPNAQHPAVGVRLTIARRS